jgi:hypothetical protein
MLLRATGSDTIQRSECHLYHVAVRLGGNVPSHLTRRRALGRSDHPARPPVNVEIGAASKAAGNVRLGEVAIESNGPLHALLHCAEHPSVLRLIKEARRLQPVGRLRALRTEEYAN